MVKVLIADDQVLIRAGMAAILRAAPGYEVVGEACDGEEAVAMAELTEPDVVLMDIRMPETDGITATRRILASGHENPPRILILTTFDLDEYVHAALRAGASGFLLKDARPEELLSGIRAVAAGDAVIAPALTRRLLREFAHLAPPRPGGAAAGPGLDSLTDREREILVAVGQGWNNAEIAAHFVLSESTVKTHVGRVLAKIGARDRIQAVIFAYDHGLARPHTD